VSKAPQKDLEGLFRHLNPDSREKLETLVSLLQRRSRLALALSGGLDSGVLLAVSSLVLPRENLFALTISSEIMPKDDLRRSYLLAATFKVRQRFVPFDHLSLEAFQKNPADRCYFCKRAMYERLLEVASQEGFFFLADGTIREDLFEDRPGLRAIRELQVVIPLAEAGFYKKDIRDLSQALGLPGYHRPASPCLATRFPTGVPITRKGLRMVRRAEEFLRALGFERFRVRFKEGEARLEFAPQEFPNFWFQRGQILDQLKKLGFQKVFFDLEGYRR